MKGISVIIPVYNRQDFLGEAIDSVLRQEYKGPLEVVVSDDGSTDRSLEIAKSFGSQVKVVLKPADCNSQGAAATRNRGIKACSYEYVCFLDSDDFYLPGHLEKMVEAIESEKAAGFSFCRVLEMDSRKGNDLYRAWTKTIISRKDITNLVISNFSVVNTDAFIIKKKVFDKVGLFNENYANGEDTEMWMRICENFVGVFSDHFGSVYRKHGHDHLTKNDNTVIIRSHFQIYKKALIRNGFNLNNQYRTIRLSILVTKFWLLTKLNFLMFFINKHYANKERKISRADVWFPLEHFTTP